MNNKNPKTFEYFYNLLCFISLYIDNQRDIKFIDDQLNTYIKKMQDINQDLKLSETDSRFGNLILDLESIIDTKTGFDNIIIEYKDFIINFNE